MAVPHTRDPNVPLKDLADGELAKASGARMKYGAAWIWILVALFFVALIWFSVSGWGGRRNQVHRAAELHAPTHSSSFTALPS